MKRHPQTSHGRLGRNVRPQHVEQHVAMRTPPMHEQKFQQAFRSPTAPMLDGDPVAADLKPAEAADLNLRGPVRLNDG